MFVTSSDDESSSIYFGFLDVPFAAQPTGENRFKEPQDPIPWDGILNTTQNQKYCYQNAYLRLPEDDLKQSEDCLYLNVYTLIVPGNKGDLPVYVWIHGGAFAEGYASVYSPQLMIDFNIIVVTIQYRLGPFGFLTTQDGVIPENLGLKDQRKALRWVNSNIRLFGGDPEKITIGGESAGGMSVGYLLLDPHINGLFRCAIQQSGSSLMRLYITQASEYAFQLGSLLDEGFSSGNSSGDLLKLLQSASSEEILTSGNAITKQYQNFEPDSLGFMKILCWGPVLENEDYENEPIVSVPMHLAFLNRNFNQVPTLIGVNSEESLFFLDYDGTESVGHGEDIVYLRNFSPLTEDDDILTRRRLIKLWSNFIIYQNPTPEPDELLNNITWPKVTNENLNYLNINKSLELRDNPRNFMQIRELFVQYVVPYVVY